MTIAHQSQEQQVAQQQQTIAITATFTAEPIEETLAFWMQELDIEFAVEFAPYNQIFQQLLDPSSLLAHNHQGINIILLRLEDWLRFSEDNNTLTQAQLKLERNIQELVMALKSAKGRSTTPYIVCLCPGAPIPETNGDWLGFYQQMENLLLSELASISGLYPMGTQELLTTYPIANYYDPQRDKLGHIPFTELFFTALGTALARKIYAINSKPYKVIVLDCDNTLWKGVVGEEGVRGIEITPDYQALQEFILAQQRSGMLICLCSKNNEADVIEVFQQRSDMPLKQEQIVAWRINWLPKSENIQALAQELNLGLDSFIFIDDNPVECAEVQAKCPEVLTLQLPVDSDIARFLHHVWAFDRLQVTAEDQQRTAMYKQNLERERLQKSALTIEEFLAGLQLKVEISEPSTTQLPRVAQLTQRTNQFNFTTIRRSESEIQQLSASGWECRMVQVSDRFGDYGLVGVIIFGVKGNALQVDTLLLSCRVLGRGVEHSMLSHLGEIAKERNLAGVNIIYIPTKKNLPALNFIESVAADFKQVVEDGYQFAIPAEVAAAISYTPDAAAAPISESISAASNGVVVEAANFEKSLRLNRIATQLYSPEKILQLIQSQPQSLRPALQLPFVAPRTETENQLSRLWAKLLRVETVGIHDNYFELGGTSLIAVELFASIAKQFRRNLPLATLLEAPTVEQLANLIDQLVESDTKNPLVLLKEGRSKPPLFLVHDGFGETLLYLNLARNLAPEVPVYGIKPLSRDGYPILHTRIDEMVAYYVENIRHLQPVGPYFLGGLCAGGVLAFAIAQQLQLQGQQVGMVAIIDAADIEAAKHVGRIASKRLSSFSQVFGQSQKLSLQQRLFYILQKATGKIINLAVYESQTKIKHISNKIKLKLLRYYLDKNLALPRYLRNISVMAVYQFAEKGYLPQGLYPGEVVLFRATEGEGDDEPYVNVYSDPLFGWGKRVTGEVKVYDIPGGHASMLQEPQVQAMAEIMQAYMDAVLLHKSKPEYQVANSKHQS